MRLWPTLQITRFPVWFFFEAANVFFLLYSLFFLKKSNIIIIIIIIFILFVVFPFVFMLRVFAEPYYMPKICNFFQTKITYMTAFICQSGENNWKILQRVIKIIQLESTISEGRKNLI